MAERQKFIKRVSLIGGLVGTIYALQLLRNSQPNLYQKSVFGPF